MMHLPSIGHARFLFMMHFFPNCLTYTVPLQYVSTSQLSGMRSAYSWCPYFQNMDLRCVLSRYHYFQTVRHARCPCKMLLVILGNARHLFMMHLLLNCLSCSVPTHDASTSQHVRCLLVSLLPIFRTCCLLMMYIITNCRTWAMSPYLLTASQRPTRYYMLDTRPLTIKRQW